MNDTGTLAERFAALAPETLTGNWNDVLGRARTARRETVRREGGPGRRLVVLAAAALVVVVVTASAFGTVRGLLFGSGRSAWHGTPSWSPDGRQILFFARSSPDGPSELWVMNADGSEQRTLTPQLGPDVAPVFLVGSPVWTPDLTEVAFWSDSCAAARGSCEGIAHIYGTNADGSGKRRLARGVRVRGRSGQRESDTHAFLAWSPDGRRLAFVSDRDGNGEIYVMNADGSGERRLTRHPASEGGGAWAPDGRRIAFVRYHRRGNEIYVTNADGSAQRLLARGRGPAWSPDGKQIAFRSDRDGNGEIYVVNVDGTDLRRLTNHPSSDGGPVWSPDGRKLLWVRAEFRRGNAEIYVMNADGSSQSNLTRARLRDSQPAWSPDGRRIVFASNRDGRGEIYVMNADGSGVRNLTRFKGGR